MPAQVLMVLWDVLAAHHRMRSWLAGQRRASAARSAALEQAWKPSPFESTCHQPPALSRSPHLRSPSPRGSQRTGGHQSPDLRHSSRCGDTACSCSPQGCSTQGLCSCSTLVLHCACSTSFCVSTTHTSALRAGCQHPLSFALYMRPTLHAPHAYIQALQHTQWAGHQGLGTEKCRVHQTTMNQHFCESAVGGRNNHILGRLWSRRRRRRRTPLQISCSRSPIIPCIQ